MITNDVCYLGGTVQVAMGILSLERMNKMQMTLINHKLVTIIIHIWEYNYTYVTVRLLSSKNHHFKRRRHGQSLVFVQ